MDAWLLTICIFHPSSLNKNKKKKKKKKINMKDISSLEGCAVDREPIKIPFCLPHQISRERENYKQKGKKMWTGAWRKETNTRCVSPAADEIEFLVRVIKYKIDTHTPGKEEADKQEREGKINRYQGGEGILLWREREIRWLSSEAAGVPIMNVQFALLECRIRKKRERERGTN